jgi:hypothetical protein
LRTVANLPVNVPWLRNLLISSIVVFAIVLRKIKNRYNYFTIKIGRLVRATTLEVVEPSADPETRSLNPILPPPITVKSAFSRSV